METDSAGFQEEFAKQLVEAGCEEGVAATLSVKSFNSERIYDSTTLPTTDTESTDGSLGLSGKFSIILAIAVSSFMSPSHNPLNMIASMLGATEKSSS